MTKKQIVVMFLEQAMEHMEVKPLLENDDDLAEFHDASKENEDLVWESVAKAEEIMKKLIALVEVSDI